MSNELYKLRPAQPDDLSFIIKLHHDTLRDYITPIWGWDETRQDGFVKNWFKPEKVEIIQSDGKDVGLIAVEKREKDTFLGSISIAPEKQGSGIGTAVVRDIMLQSRLPARLQVLKTNPRAKALYGRMGFVLEKETATHFEMTFER